MEILTLVNSLFEFHLRRQVLEDYEELRENVLSKVWIHQLQI